MRLFSKKGLDATTIDDIVGSVDVSRRTFFRYFDAKEDVLPAWFDTHVVSLLEIIDERPAGKALSRVCVRRKAFAGLYQSQMVHVLTIERVIGREPSLVARRYARMEQVSDGLAKRLAARSRGKTRDEVRFRLLARVALAAGSSAIERWVAGGGKGNLLDTLDACWGSVERAFAPSRKLR